MNVAGYFLQMNQGLDKESIIIQERREPRLPVFPGMKKFIGLLKQTGQVKNSCWPMQLLICLISRCRKGFAARSVHQCVPTQYYFIIQLRRVRHSFFEQFFPPRFQYFV
jgi:hypothetical protein